MSDKASEVAADDAMPCGAFSVVELLAVSNVFWSLFEMLNYLPPSLYTVQCPLYAKLVYA